MKVISHLYIRFRGGGDVSLSWPRIRNATELHASVKGLVEALEEHGRIVLVEGEDPAQTYYVLLESVAYMKVIEDEEDEAPETPHLGGTSR